MTLVTAVEGIGHMLSDRLLAIPDYQRAYSWGLDEVSDLWQDLSDAIEKGVTEYFLGSVVTTSSEAQPRHQVIDGQQRLATVALMYASMRSIFKDREDERWRDIQRDLLGKQHMTTRALEPRLVLNAEDNPVFQALTLDPDSPPEAQQDSHRRLVAAHDFFLDRFNESIDGMGVGEWQGPLLRWYEFVFESARVIDVSVSDESRAFIIFETLNDRGLNLSTADLLKNHLFGQAGTERVEEAKLRWSRAMAPFVSGVGGELDTDTFLRHYWASRKGVVRVKALYSQIRPDISTSQEAVDFADDLANASPLWAAMFDRDAELWRSYSEGALGALDTLRNLKVEQCRPLLLAGLRKLAREEMEELLSLVVGWSIRWFVVGGGGGGVVERLYAQAAKRVMDGQRTSAEEIAADFSESVPNDTSFREAFESLAVRRGWLARYYLTALESARADQVEPEFVPNQDVDQVNLEHVLPRNPRPEDWAEFSEDQLQNMRLLLGNQALLRKSQNSAIGNKPFNKKKPVLAASSLAWTKEIGDLESWSPQAVTDRQVRMAALAPGIWRKE